MKYILIKIFITVLAVLLFAAVIFNGYFCYISYKLSIAHNIFEKLDVVREYRIFHYLWLSTFSLFTTVILLITTLILTLRKTIKLN